MSLTDAVDRCDLPTLIGTHCGPEAVRGLGTTGGTIRDPRPGREDVHPSFSVWKNARGTWMWKRRGGHAEHGTAFDFLKSIGVSGPDARAELLRVTGTSGAWSQSGTPEPTRLKLCAPDILTVAREKLDLLKPVTHRELSIFRVGLKPLAAQDAPALDLARRGLWPCGDLQAYAHRTDLVFAVNGPTGRVYNCKRRRFHRHQGVPITRYSTVFVGLGTPAWCSPRYGRAGRVLLVEGELNAAAAWQAIRARELDFDVQGLPGSDTWPFLEGLDREVWIYADPDASGEGMRARLQDLAFAAGARRVHQVPPLAEGDFCDVLGTHGIDALTSSLFAERSEPPGFDGSPVPVAARMLSPVLLGEQRDVLEWPLQRPRRG